MVTTVTHPLSLLCSSDVASGPEPQSLSLSILFNALGLIQFQITLKTSQLSHDCLDTVAGASSAPSYPHPQVQLYKESGNTSPPPCCGPGEPWWRSSDSGDQASRRAVQTPVKHQPTISPSLVSGSEPAVVKHLWRHRSIRRQVPPGDSLMKTNNTF